MVSKNRGSNYIIMTALAVLFILAFLTSFMVGRYGVSISDVFRVFSSKLFGTVSGVPEMIETIVLKVRTPRILGAVLVGGALSVSGTAYQGLFKNPMASPDILGASSGAAFGAAIAILLSFSFAGIQVSAFLFGLLATALTFFISVSVSRGKDVLLILVLSGMVISTLFSSFITMVKYVADPFSKLPEITYWLMGGLNSVTTQDIKAVILPMVLGFTLLILFRWKLNTMAFGDEEAKSMGVDTTQVRYVIIFASTLLVAASVSISGIVGWVGLVIPHLTRLLVGPNLKILVPASFLVGSIYLLVIDSIVRTAFSIEIPLGILTSIIGAPFFVFLLRKRKKVWI